VLRRGTGTATASSR